jgi:hypothetical protein
VLCRHVALTNSGAASEKRSRNTEINSGLKMD